MGLLTSKLYSLYEYFGGGRETRIAMVGLDSAGKTTILYQVKLNEKVTTIPTVGFNVETVSPAKGVTFTVWDFAGQERLRQLWKYYYANAEGLIFVIDSADRERVEEARSELYNIFDSRDMDGVPLEIIANKQDFPDAMSPAEIVDKLQLHSLKGHKWHIQPACATTGDGLWEAMESMSQLVKDFKKTKPSYF